MHVGPLAYVGPDAVIGADSILLAGAVLGAGARLGRSCTLRERAMLLDGCCAGDRVVLQAGAVVGADGFGYVFLDGAFTKIPQVGNVVLGDDVEIGANTCVDRAQTGSTTIGAGTKIDNLVQVGHNCRIGRHCAFAAMTGLAGSAIIGDYTVVRRPKRVPRPYHRRLARQGRRQHDGVERRSRRGVHQRRAGSGS